MAVVGLPVGKVERQGILCSAGIIRPGSRGLAHRLLVCVGEAGNLTRSRKRGQLADSLIVRIGPALRLRIGSAHPTAPYRPIGGGRFREDCDLRMTLAVNVLPLLQQTYKFADRCLRVVRQIPELEVLARLLRMLSTAQGDLVRA